MFSVKKGVSAARAAGLRHGAAFEMQVPHFWAARSAFGIQDEMNIRQSQMMRYAIRNHIS